jgi:hypothetical protein
MNLMVFYFLLRKDKILDGFDLAEYDFARQYLPPNFCMKDLTIRFVLTSFFHIL